MKELLEDFLEEGVEKWYFNGEVKKTWEGDYELEPPFYNVITKSTTKIARLEDLLVFIYNKKKNN